MLGTALRWHKARNEAGEDEITDGGVGEEIAGEAGAVEEGVEIGPGKVAEEGRNAHRTDEGTNDGGVVVVVVHAWHIRS